MRRWLKKGGLLLAGFLIGGVLAHGLVGCVGPVGSEARAMRGFMPGFLTPESPEFIRFREEFEAYAPAGDDDLLDLFEEVYLKVRDDYVRPVAEKDLIDAALKGMKEAKPEEGEPVTRRFLVEAALDGMTNILDPHTHYLDPEAFKDMQIRTSGRFGGLGITVTLDKESGAVRVISPIDDTPAFRAGIQAGDLITALDGDPIKGKKLSDAVRIMRGEPGSEIRLTVLREAQPEFDVTIVRAIVHVKPVSWRVEGDYGYVRVTSFSQETDEGLVAAVEDLTARVGPGLKGYVLDLRNNPGGLLSEAVTLADGFLDEGTVVSVRGRDGRRVRTHKAKWGDLARNLPIVVLINRGSASAAEIVSGALQDHKRATIMGTRSFGKGSVQVVTPLRQEGGLKLTTDLYYSPSGRTIHGSGIGPDIELIPPEPEKNEDGEPPPPHDLEADQPHTLKVEKSKVRDPVARLPEESCPEAGEDGKDRGLGCALVYLRAGAVPAFLATVGVDQPQTH